MAENNDFENTYGSLDGSKEKEFMRLLVPSQRRIFSYIVTIVPNLYDAEDILQDTMAIMWRKFDDFERGSHFVAWGIAIAKNRIMKYRTSMASSKLKLDDDVVGVLETQAGEMFEKLDERMGILKGCINKLSDKENNLLKMRYEQDLSYRKIATLVGLTSTAVFKSISQVHCKLMRCIKRTLNLES